MATKRNRICVVVPTRGRPAAQLQAVASIIGNSVGYADVLIVSDIDDDKKLAISGPNIQTLINRQKKPLLQLLNEAVLANLDDYHIFGYAGDDVVYESPYWDAQVWNILRHGIGVVYGSDGIQDKNLPTHPWFSADLAKALGYAVPPCLAHYFFDNYLKELTEPLGALHWRPSIVTRHRHYSVSDGIHYDNTYQRGESFFAQDKQAFEHYAETDLAADRAKLKAYAANMRITGELAANPPNSRKHSE